MKKFLCICLSATIQRTVTFENLELRAVNRSLKFREDASGKAMNAARVMNQLEKNCVTAICATGRQNQEHFVSLAEKDSIQTIAVPTPGATRQCWTLLNSADSSTTELVVSESRPSESFFKTEKKLLSIIKAQVKKADAVLLAGSRPESWSPDLYIKIAAIVKAAGKIFMADYQGRDLLFTVKSTVPDIIKINQEEYEKTFSPDTKLSPFSLQASIMKKSQELKNIIVVTRGAQSTFSAIKGEFHEEPALKIQPVNTTACGDSFNAGFLYEYANTQNFTNALKLGTKCAALNAQFECPGTIQKN